VGTVLGLSELGLDWEVMQLVVLSCQHRRAIFVYPNERGDGTMASRHGYDRRFRAAFAREIAGFPASLWHKNATLMGPSQYSGADNARCVPNILPS